MPVRPCASAAHLHRLRESDIAEPHSVGRRCSCYPRDYEDGSPGTKVQNPIYTPPSTKTLSQLPTPTAQEGVR